MRTDYCSLSLKFCRTLRNVSRQILAITVRMVVFNSYVIYLIIHALSDIPIGKSHIDRSGERKGQLFELCIVRIKSISTPDQVVNHVNVLS